jgi:hypothetical protein
VNRDRNYPQPVKQLKPLALPRSLAISLPRLDGHATIAAANRHHARDPRRTLKLLQAA